MIDRLARALQPGGHLAFLRLRRVIETSASENRVTYRFSNSNLNRAEGNAAIADFLGQHFSRTSGAALNYRHGEIRIQHAPRSASEHFVLKLPRPDAMRHPYFRQLLEKNRSEPRARPVAEVPSNRRRKGRPPLIDYD